MNIFERAAIKAEELGFTDQEAMVQDRPLIMFPQSELEDMGRKCKIGAHFPVEVFNSLHPLDQVTLFSVVIMTIARELKLRR